MTTADRIAHFTRARIEIERLITKAAELVHELNERGHVAYFHYEQSDNHGNLNFHAQYRNPETEAPDPLNGMGKIVLQPSEYPQPPSGPPGGEDDDEG